MKKLWLFIVMLSASIILIGCEPTNQNEEIPIHIDILSMSGDGSIESPYVKNISVGDSFELEYEVTPSTDIKPTYQLVKIENTELTPLKSRDLKGLSINQNTTPVVVTGVIPGENYIKMTIKNTSVYVKVTVAENEHLTEQIDFTKRLKVLAIGNSFSDDGMEFLYDIAASYGIEEIVLGNLVIGGSTLETHLYSAAQNSKAYVYRKNTSGTWISYDGKTALDGITDEAWDIITLQQASGKSGMTDTYDPYLLQLIHYINAYKTNPYVRIYWHMTWAYQQNSTHTEFSNYNNNQQTMYDMIVDTYEAKVSTNPRITGVIPSGTAIQNTRTSFLGDTLTRDGYHLSYDIGRYTAGLTWFKSITGLSLDDVDFSPMGVRPSIVSAIKESVNNAFSNPFEITNSTYTEDPQDHIEYSIENMTQILPNYVVGYWLSTLNETINTSEPNSNYFLANEVRLTPNDLPVGSIIILEEGYQYRINYFTSNSAILFNTRTDFITIRVLLVTPYMWQNYGSIGINISSIIPNTDMTSNLLDANTILKIYIPGDES